MDLISVGNLFWIAMLILSVIISVALFLVHEFWILPPIARQLRKAKRAKGSPAFVQNKAGRVNFTLTDEELPEGVVHIKRLGWFLVAKPPAVEQKRQLEGKVAKKEKLTKDEQKILETALEVPVLEGLGKAVFFGYEGVPFLTNLKTLVHADLRNVQKILPATISSTQLSALHKFSLLKGYEKRGGEGARLIIMALAVVAVLGSLGIITYLLLSVGG